jgi:hypothetical protein
VYGVAAEPSAHGARIRFDNDYPPSIEPLSQDLGFWAGRKPATLQEEGIMPLILRMNKVMDVALDPEKASNRDHEHHPLVACPVGHLPAAGRHPAVGRYGGDGLEDPTRDDRASAF